MYIRKSTTAAFFSEHPVFNSEEFDESFAGKGPRANQTLLGYHVEAGNILRIRRGLFAVVPPSANANTFFVDPFLIASKIAPDSVISHHSALRFHGLAQSIRRIVTFTSKHKDIKSFEFQGSTFEAVLTARALIVSGNENSQVQQFSHQGGQIKVTTIERTVVDCIDRFEIAGGLEEVLRSCTNLLGIDDVELLKYILLLNNRSTIAKVGFLMEKLDLFYKPSTYEILRENLPKSPAYLFRKVRHGVLIKRWNLIVPPEVANIDWGQKL